MARFNGAVHHELRANGTVIQDILSAQGHPSDVICAFHWHTAQAREFAATIIGLADMLDAREGVEIGGEAHRSANVILPPIDLREGQWNMKDPRIEYGLSGRGKA